MSAKAPENARRTPESLRLRSVTPAFTVTDLQRSIAWYRDVIGFFVEETWEHDGRVSGVSLKAGSVSLLLSQDDFAKGRDRAKGQGFRLHLGTAQSIDDIAKGIEERGGVLETRPADMPWGVRAFSLVDPDGYKLTVSSAE